MIILHHVGRRSSFSLSRDHLLRVCNQSIFSLTVLISKYKKEFVQCSTVELLNLTCMQGKDFNSGLKWTNESLIGMKLCQYHIR